MGTIIRSPRDRVSIMLENAADKMGEAGLMIILALVKAWNVYSEKRDKKRPGRRASDHELAHLKGVCERTAAAVELLTGALKRLTDRVEALEHDGESDTPR